MKQGLMTDEGMLSDMVIGTDIVLVGFCLLDFESILGALLVKFLKLYRRE